MKKEGLASALFFGGMALLIVGIFLLSFVGDKVASLMVPGAVVYSVGFLVSGVGARLVSGGWSGSLPICGLALLGAGGFMVAYNNSASVLKTPGIVVFVIGCLVWTHIIWEGLNDEV